MSMGFARRFTFRAAALVAGVVNTMRQRNRNPDKTLSIVTNPSSIRMRPVRFVAQRCFITKHPMAAASISMRWGRPGLSTLARTVLAQQQPVAGHRRLEAYLVEPIHNGYFLEIRGLLDRQETTLFVRHKQGIEKRSPMLLRRTKDSHAFEFSTVVARRFNSVLVILEMKLKAYSQLHLATAVFRPSKKDGMIDADFKPSDIIARIPLNERFPEQPSAANRSPNTERSRRAASQPNQSTTMAQAFKSARAERKNDARYDNHQSPQEKTHRGRPAAGGDQQGQCSGEVDPPRASVDAASVVSTAALGGGAGGDLCADGG
ncbi:hypothetical protein THIOKS11270014 [Thiocapsa sp. KS1]|nr:hypothetical protein THIOKS11270014 [Thiocapsa sp. KS1]